MDAVAVKTPKSFPSQFTGVSKPEGVGVAVGTDEGVATGVGLICGVGVDKEGVGLYITGSVPLNKYPVTLFHAAKSLLD